MTVEDILQIPSGFPPPLFPDENNFTVARWQLGKKLFYDPILSRDSSLSCASCHLPNYAFSDTTAFSSGVENAAGTRNSPSLANVAYHPYFTREGGVPTLEMQILIPIQEHNEFDFNIVLISEKLQADETYQQMAMEAYEQAATPFVITRALSTFERSLLSGNSRYDKFAFQNQENALNEIEKMGMNLFFSEKTNCSHCHSGFNFTDYAFENNGLYENYEDVGRFRLTGNEDDIALFKTPSLRNISLTAPYMHDGSMSDLKTVVEHYVSGGKNHVHKNEILQPLDLTIAEQEAIIAFLESLTDNNFINNKNFMP
ncbi:MAG: cytochrome-c peroxidase [Chitinophagales bacterium]